MNNDVKELITVLRELKVSFGPTLNTKEKIIEAITQGILENPDVSNLSRESLRILQSLGFSLVLEDGRGATI